MQFGIALGSNLGDRLAHLRFGREQLKARLGAESVVCSGVYETEPVDCPPGSPGFLNAVIELDSALDAESVLRHCLEIEAEAGRQRGNVPNAARPLDLDVLFANGLEINSPHLQVPHPRLTGRAFVLVPLAEIHADLILPGQSKPVWKILDELDDDTDPPMPVCQNW